MPNIGDLFQGMDLPISDDELDARIAWALGRLWIEDEGSVNLLGNLEYGTFLLPKIMGLEEAFLRFAQ